MGPRSSLQCHASYRRDGRRRTATVLIVLSLTYVARTPAPSSLELWTNRKIDAAVCQSNGADGVSRKRTVCRLGLVPSCVLTAAGEAGAAADIAPPHNVGGRLFETEAGGPRAIWRVFVRRRDGGANYDAIRHRFSFGVKRIALRRLRRRRRDVRTVFAVLRGKRILG